MPVEDLDFSLHELMEQALKCRASYHPNHSGCGVTAVYVLLLVDVDHEIRHSVPLCDGHSVSYCVSARDNRWCECVEPYRHCWYDQIELVRVS